MRKNIAVVWGGYSSEIVVSAKSMDGICTFLDKEKYNIYKIKISDKVWTVNIGDDLCVIDKNDFSFTLPQSDSKISIDFAYITIHGTPGEDGRLQGYFDMIGIPYSSCGMMASALTSNKFVCNKFLKNFGFNIANSYLVRQGQSYSVDIIVSKLGLPVFVKPNTGGSSFATTKVKIKEELTNAIKIALDEADEVIIEQFIKGREVTSGCYKINNKEVLLPLTEVVTQNEFFDYNAKYKGQVQEITPAPLKSGITENIQKLTSLIYDLINARGIIRVDYIISEYDQPWLLEVNTTPGMTSTSFIPQQIKAAGLNITDVLSDIIENEYKKRKH